MRATTTLNEIKEARGIDQEENFQFYKSCQSFLIEAVRQIQNRFSLEDKIHDIVGSINPRSASLLKPASLAYLFDALPQLD